MIFKIAVAALSALCFAHRPCCSHIRSGYDRHPEHNSYGYKGYEGKESYSKGYDSYGKVMTRTARATARTGYDSYGTSYGYDHGKGYGYDSCGKGWGYGKGYDS
ncbi:hypothetical protein BDK51DRAFT_34381 [Blyttiomyces helicus]|uniref:Uncharacterized protein n=1 Tax=Blyttiomyces helicus TaxID=388810 RepID=A0A4P9W1M5_9FUNG|nr:hypothetical protein BDK51DRAFT_34381 [Blyttiomyces helicus]|eukprot:RKO85255.1 hypothetical protein BDK51DRAFT_34381 [Blyttiomyces helicus]